ncbi:hypothetical protein C1H57_08460 [Clostridium sp. 2-1]|uniref:hypothetical protein n=1 Tax=Clostridium TaxID=1485 RepID=UPI000CDA182E|nr:MULTISPECIES: hypothetical protein [Clostridium]MBN7575439.1 hypothetical protein [Clostridium beijerinckii]MBN7580750.1 hypothetical protein [Clostridium beijerinckii]MBN7585203.1 hypothetical protein [Clostridium beijerinckii]MBO0521991.1 hypothetical protein [Clostridium beijerinckii]POO91840.1 hypothetical protein C1H57_08460 [Clostridium sp. 2-1]
MAKGVRKTIILNENNPKEKLILDELGKQYNYSEFIKDALFSYIKNNNILHDDNLMINELSHNDNKMVIQLPHDDNEVITQLSNNDNNNFFIDISNVSDTELKIDTDESENPSQNALDFLKNNF